MFSDKKFVVIGVGMTLIWLFAMTFMLMPALVARWDAFAKVMCTDEQCTVQGWLDALSGWAGALAAAITLAALLRQIKEANRHQRENLELQISSKIALARWIRNDLEFTPLTLRSFIDAVASKTATSSSLLNHISIVANNFDRELVNAFEREIGTRQRKALEQIDAHFRLIKEFISSDPAQWVWTFQEDGGNAEHRRREALTTYANVLIHNFESIVGDADTFIERWHGRISR